MPDLDRSFTGTRIADFGGLRTNADPHDIKPGESVVQKNCGGSTRGVLKTRYGVKSASFEDGDDAAEYAALVCLPINTPLGDRIIYQRESGAIVFGTNPA